MNPQTLKARSTPNCILPISHDNLTTDKRMQCLLQMEHIEKSFPGVHALKDVSLEIRPGEIHALIGKNGAGNSMTDHRGIIAEAEKYILEVGLHENVRTLCGDLSIAKCPMVEIAKALSVNAKLIIMAEPTSSLTDCETEMLMDLIRRWKRDGVSVVFNIPNFSSEVALQIQSAPLC